MSNVLRAINQSLFLVTVVAEAHPILNLWQDLFSVLDFFKADFPICVFVSYSLCIPCPLYLCYIKSRDCAIACRDALTNA